MNEHTGISDYDGTFTPIEQTKGPSDKQVPTTGGDLGGDRYGLSYLPKLFSHLEEHFSFSAALCSILGYVVIASFGEMQTLGQYFGFIFFLSLIWLVYSLKEDKKIWKHLFFSISFLLLLITIYTNWNKIIPIYHTLNVPFNLSIAPKERTEVVDAVSVKNTNSTTTKVVK